MMNSTFDSKQTPAPGSKDEVIIIKEEVVLFNVIAAVTVVLSLVGMVTNSLNIKTFLSMGTNDGVTVSLFALSLSDFGFCITGFVQSATHLTDATAIELGFVISVNSIVTTDFFVTIGYAFYAMTTMTTTFLAVARCMCVAMPFHFKNVFTTSRSFAIHICFAVISIGGYLPVLSQMGVRKYFDTRYNKTRYGAWYSDKREGMKEGAFIFFDIMLTFTAQIVLIVCVAIMAHCLRQSGKFRQQLSKATAAVGESGNETHDDEGFKLSGKELQVVQQVSFISSICIVCALPKICTAFYTLLEPEFAILMALHNYYAASAFLRKDIELINSATTLLVYYKYNYRFRTLCFQSCSQKNVNTNK